MSVGGGGRRVGLGRRLRCCSVGVVLFVVSVAACSSPATRISVSTSTTVSGAPGAVQASVATGSSPSAEPPTSTVVGVSGSTLPAGIVPSSGASPRCGGDRDGVGRIVVGAIGPTHGSGGTVAGDGVAGAHLRRRAAAHTGLSGGVLDSVFPLPPGAPPISYLLRRGCRPGPARERASHRLLGDQDSTRRAAAGVSRRSAGDVRFRRRRTPRAGRDDRW